MSGVDAPHIATHICGDYEEIEQHVTASKEGRPLDRTRTWEEREQPLRALDHATLQQRIEDLAVATAEAIGDVLDRRPEAELTWTGRTVRISGFSTPFAARTRSIVGTSLATTKRAASCSPSRICLSTR